MFASLIIATLLLVFGTLVMLTVDDLVSAVASLTATVDAAVKEISSLKAQVASLTVDATKVDQAAKDVKAANDKLVAELPAETPPA